MTATAASAAADDDTLLAGEYRNVRAASLHFCRNLEIEDFGLQAIPETSPVKWHLAHTTWFFETFVLRDRLPGYRVFHPVFAELFNSYYQAVGPQFPRARRHLLSRPTVREVFAYRAHVDDAMARLLAGGVPDETRSLVVLGLHHEQQHQELFFTDLKYNLALNPLAPAYAIEPLPPAPSRPAPLAWQAFPGGPTVLGSDGDEGFVFDNETPRHQALLQPFELASRLVTNGEFLAFVEDGGYREPRHWLADGWAWVRDNDIRHPLYWRCAAGEWREFTLHGETLLDPARPVCHVNAYEADAYARWAGARLPTEAEWEHVARQRPVTGQFVESGRHHPDAAVDDQLFGALWQWTGSAYRPWPGFRAPRGAIGEYNAKFMCNQLVLRGGSCVSARRHLRATYRNFFYPVDRWQFSGIRLARDPGGTP